MPFLWIFSIFKAGALALAGVELRSNDRAPAPPARVPAAVAITLLLVAFVLQAVIAALVVAQGDPANYGVPAPVSAGPRFYADAFAAAVLALGLLQSWLLLQLYRSRVSMRAVAIGGSVLFALACFAPLLFSRDAYAYIAYASLGAAAYAPAHAPFTGELAAIGTWWGNDLPPCVYGPVWLGASIAATGAIPTLLGKFVALRALCALAYAVFIASLLALRVPTRGLAVAAINPALAFAFVTDMHNDLFGVALVLAAAACVRRAPLAAVVLIVAGGLVKLPLAVFGLPVLAAVAPLSRRIVLGAATVILATAISIGVGGRGFVAASAPHVVAGGVTLVLTLATATAAIAATLVAAGGGRRLRSAVWLIPLASASTLPWYLAWSLPYAAARRRVLGYALVGFPLAAALIDVKFMRPWTLLAVVPLAFVLQAAAFSGVRLRRTPRPEPA